MTRNPGCRCKVFCHRHCGPGHTHCSQFISQVPYCYPTAIQLYQTASSLEPWLQPQCPLISLIPTGQLNVTTPILSVLHALGSMTLACTQVSLPGGPCSPRVFIIFLVYPTVVCVSGHVFVVYPTVVCVLGHVFVNAHVHLIVETRGWHQCLP